MAKKVGVTLIWIFVVVLSVVTLYAFLLRRAGESTAAGFAIRDLSFGINISLVAFIGQWVLLLILVLFTYTRFLKHRKEEEKKIVGFVVPPPKSRGETNIDAFYELLKDKKELAIGTIAKAFKITKEQALDWAKILEDNELVSIEYPAFADPEVKFKDPLVQEKMKMQERIKANDNKPPEDEEETKDDTGEENKDGENNKDKKEYPDTRKIIAKEDSKDKIQEKQKSLGVDKEKNVNQKPVR